MLKLRCVSVSLCVHASVCVQFAQFPTNTRQMATQLFATGGGNTQRGTERVTSTSSNETDICTEIHLRTQAAQQRSGIPISQSI